MCKNVFLDFVVIIKVLSSLLLIQNFINVQNILIKLHIILDYKKNWIMLITYVSTHDPIVDIFTKGIAIDKF